MVRSWGADGKARAAMIADLKRRGSHVGARRIVLAYEACGFGFLLHDELAAAGIECHVLAPSKMARSAKHRKRKTDERDAQMILNQVRAYVLAGVEMPSVWIPDLLTRDDRELIRLRLAAGEHAGAVQTRIRWLLKRNGIETAPAKAWTEIYWQWLDQLPGGGQLGCGASAALESLIRQLRWLKSEIERLDAQVLALSQAPRFAPVVAALRMYKGVGVLTAMVYLTEMDVALWHHGLEAQRAMKAPPQPRVSRGENCRAFFGVKAPPDGPGGQPPTPRRWLPPARPADEGRADIELIFQTGQAVGMCNRVGMEESE